jgi:energy-coupling factor transporter ATP-binding protein EcfA2
MLRPFSDRPRGLFVTVDGPSGAGKSTVVEHLAQLLVGDGEEVHVTAEPSSGPIGGLCRELTETVTGHALACLYAADRYHHLETEIRPATEADRLIQAGFDVLRVDVNQRPPEQAAMLIRNHLTCFFSCGHSDRLRSGLRDLHRDSLGP